MIRPVDTVASMASYTLADLGDTSAFSLAENESAFPPSPLAIEAARRVIADSAIYPDPAWRNLRDAIADVHVLAPDTIFCGAGSMELIGCLIRAFAGPSDEILGSRFGYLFTATAASQAGAEYVQADEPDLAVSVDGVLTRLTPQTRIVFLCNPGNPTGTRIPNADLVRLRAELPEDVLLVVDGAYAEFDDQDHRAIFALVDQQNTVVTRSFSKAYGLAGARVGWACCPPNIGAEMRKLLNPNNVSVASQAMATAAVRDQAYMRCVVQQTASIRDAFSARVQAAGLHSPESYTNFSLMRFQDSEQAAAMDKRLRKSGFILRGLGGYGLPDCLRATMGQADAMERVAEILEEGA